MNWRSLSLGFLVATTVACGGGGSSSPSPTTPPPTTPPPDTSDKWASVASMPGPRSELAATALDGRLYVAGGGTALNGDAVVVPDSLWIYDPGTDAWSTGAPVPAPAHHMALVGHAGKLYLIGGWQGSGLGMQELDTMWIYDIATDAWSMGPAMPTARGAHAAAVIDGQIHVVGGSIAHRNFNPDLPLGTHEIYDIASGGWVTGTDLTNGREHLGAAVIGGKLYVAAGRVAGTASPRLDVYDPATQQWSSLATVPTPRSGVALVAFQGELYLLGGERFPENTNPGFGDAVGDPIPNSQTFATVEVYDPATDTWREIEPMPTRRHGLGAGVIGNAIYAVGGGPEAGWWFTDANERWTP